MVESLTGDKPTRLTSPKQEGQRFVVVLHVPLPVLECPFTFITGLLAHTLVTVVVITAVGGAV